MNLDIEFLSRILDTVVKNVKEKNDGTLLLRVADKFVSHPKIKDYVISINELKQKIEETEKTCGGCDYCQWDSWDNPHGWFCEMNDSDTDNRINREDKRCIKFKRIGEG